MRENNGDSVEAGQVMSLGRVTASPAMTNADNTKLRATISEDSASSTAPASSSVSNFMAGEEQTSVPEVNHIIAGIRNKKSRERTGRQTQTDTEPVFNGL